MLYFIYMFLNLYSYIWEPIRKRWYKKSGLWWQTWMSKKATIKNYFAPRRRGTNPVNKELRFLQRSSITHRSHTALLWREPQEEGPSSLINAPHLWFTVNELNSVCGRRKRDVNFFSLSLHLTVRSKDWGCRALTKCASLSVSLLLFLYHFELLSHFMWVCVIETQVWWGSDSKSGCLLLPTKWG